MEGDTVGVDVSMGTVDVSIRTVGVTLGLDEGLGVGLGGEDVGDGEAAGVGDGEYEDAAEGDGVSDGDGEGAGVSDEEDEAEAEGDGVGDGDCANAEVATVTSGLIGIVTVLISSEETGLSKSPNITVICDIRTFS